MTRDDVLLVTVECARADRGHLLSSVQDLHVSEGVTMGSYTRPSLAGLVSGQYRAAAATEPRGPTLPAVLGEAGYQTAGFCHSPQCAASLAFGQGFDYYQNRTSGGSRGAWWRERLAEYRPVRQASRWLRPKAATLEGVQPDGQTVDEAVEWWTVAEAPRFCWVHLMGSHRPYGWADGLPSSLGRRAAGATPSHLTPSLTAGERGRVLGHYENGLEFVDRQLARLRDAVGDETTIVVAGDHGEELGEEGYWFHGPYRQRLTETLTRVPVATTIDHDADVVGLADIAPSVCEAVGASVPSAWDGQRFGEARQWLTLAPWADSCAVAYQTPHQTLRFEDASLGSVTKPTLDDETRQQLKALGYA